MLTKFFFFFLPPPPPPRRVNLLVIIRCVLFLLSAFYSDLLTFCSVNVSTYQSHDDIFMFFVIENISYNGNGPCD